MYEPAHFRVEDRKILHDFIRAHPLGLVISCSSDGPVADPVPFLLDADAGTMGVLRAHMAKANPHGLILAKDQKACVVFQVSGHYISPGWYPSKKEHGRVVPTWNYITVQVRGRVRMHEDTNWLLQHVTALSDSNEGALGETWKVSDAPPPFVAAQLRAIVGFEIEIEDMKGKFKLSQNRQDTDRSAVLAALEQQGQQGAAIAALMRQQGIGI